MKYKDKAVAGRFVFPLCLRVFLVILCRDQVLKNVKKWSRHCSFLSHNMDEEKSISERERALQEKIARLEKKLEGYQAQIG